MWAPPVALALLALVAYLVMTRPLQLPAAAVTDAYVINLARNGERLERFTASFNAADLATSVGLQRLDATDGREVDWAAYVHSDAMDKMLEVERTGKRQGHPDLTPGAVGCYLSHMRAWRRIADSGAPHGFVFEDDATLRPDAMARFETAVRELREAGHEWDMVLLGHWGTGTPVSPGAQRMDSFLLLHGYVLSARAARFLCDHMLPIKQQVDWELNEHIRSGALRVYGLRHMAAEVQWQGTDIQTPLA